MRETVRKRTKPQIPVLFKIFTCLLTLLLIGQTDLAKARTVPEKNNKPELVVQTGNYSLVEEVKFSPDGRILASSGGQYLKLVDVATGKELRTFEKHNSTRLSGVVFSPDGKFIAGLHNDIEIWNIETKENKTCSILTPEMAAFSFDAKLLAAATEEGIGLCDLETGKVRTIPNPETRAVGFEPQTDALISIDSKGDVIKWDSKTGRKLHRFSILSRRQAELPDYPIRNIEFSYDGHKLAVAFYDGLVQIWDLRTGKLLKKIDDLESFTTIAFLADDKYIAAITADRKVIFQNLETGERVLKTPAALRETAALQEVEAAVAISRNGSLLAIGTNDSRVKVINLETGGEKFTFERYTVPFVSFAFSPSGRIMATAQGGLFSSMSIERTENTFKLWNWSEKQETRILLKAKPGGSSNGVRDFSFSPDEKKMPPY